MSRNQALAAWLLVLGAATRPVTAGTITLQATQSDAKPFVGAVVTLQGAAHPHVAPVNAILDQINLAFAPDLIVIPVGSTVEFPNSDSVSHQIYSFSPTKRFQLPLYHGQPYPPVHFDQAGIVTLGCNIHDQMVGYVFVTDAAYFGRTDAAGAWTVTNLPLGSYHLSLWHPLMREATASLERDVTVADDEPVTLKLQLAHPLRRPPLPATVRRDQY
jgi:plastocyanin